jgi:hypothetical protein
MKKNKSCGKLKMGFEKRIFSSSVKAIFLKETVRTTFRFAL